MKNSTLSYSSLKEFLKSPAHFVAYKNREVEETPAMRFGTAVHMAILEPAQFEEKYLMTENRRNTKAYKAEVEQYPDATFLSKSEVKSIREITFNFKLNPSAYKMVANCTKYEEEVEGTINDVPFRGFVDGWNQKAKYCIDIKTTSDASPDAFTKSVYNFGYHLQAAIYKELTGCKDYYIIAIENKPPHTSVVYKLSEGFLDSGFALLHQGISKWKEWDGNWRGYDNDTLGMLPWMK